MVTVTLKRPHWDDSHPTDTRVMRSMDDVRKANEFNGYLWFSPPALKFFHSRVHDALYGGRYFVTSECDHMGAPRRFTVREILPTGEVETVGDFMAYKSRTVAHSVAKSLAVEKG